MNWLHFEHEQYDNLTAFICGFTGGAIKLIDNKLLQVPAHFDINYLQNLGETGITALVCGFLGIAGKHLFILLIKRKKNENK